MKQILSGLIAGLLFGIGLSVSEMMNPAKVVGFLDVLGSPGRQANTETALAQCRPLTACRKPRSLRF